jgi:uncharacterized RDD family membrane protein YckC
MIAGDRLDTIYHIATPEGCAIDLRVAGPVARARAWFLDFLVRLMIWLLLAISASMLGDFGFGLLLLGAFLLEWFYPIVFEVYGQGQTPGKRSCGLAVVHDDGRPIGWSAAFIRNTLRGIDFLPLLYAAGFVSSLMNAQGKRIGDLAAGTVVVHVAGVRRLPAGEGDVGGEAPPFALTRDEQVAVIEFSQTDRRHEYLPGARAAHPRQFAVAVSLCSLRRPLSPALRHQGAGDQWPPAVRDRLSHPDEHP